MLYPAHIPTILAELDWTNLISNLGISTVILIALGIASWKTMSWVGREIIIPLRDRLLVRLAGFFDKVDNALQSLTDHMIQHTEAMNKLQKATEANSQAWLSLKDSLHCKYAKQQEDDK